MIRPLRSGMLAIIACSGLLFACDLPRSSVSFTDATGHGRRLIALEPNARDGILSGDGQVAAFGLPLQDGMPLRGEAVEVELAIESIEAVRVSLILLGADQLGDNGALVADPVFPIISGVENASGLLRLRMLFPSTTSKADQPVSGFAVQLGGKADSRVRILSASLVTAETGWQKTADAFWAGFPAAGGVIDASSPRSFALALDRASSLALSFGGSTDSPGTIADQDEAVFSAGNRRFAFRHSPSPYRTSIPSFLLADKPIPVKAVSGDEHLTGLRVSVGKAWDASRPTDPKSPIQADPLVIIDWPQSAWRESRREVFAWDRFPSILIFDTADYSIQDRYFKRLAFFVEKSGYIGKLSKDADIANLHAFNAHDYRAESLAAFFELARIENFALNAEENELLDILLAEGIVVKKNNFYTAGIGAVLSFSRQSVQYLRYLFMAHEGYHGIYFIDAELRSVVAQIRQAMDARSIAFLESYFTIVDSLGYDVSDAYLMENELFGYLMQQPVDRVAAYFTGTIHERFVRYGGEPALADYIEDTEASDFVLAAEKLNAYVFGRWGIAGGRNGLFRNE